MIQVTKFLRLLSQEEHENTENLGNDENISPSKENVSAQKPKRKPSKSTMNPIEEEEDLLNLTDHIGDVSIKE